MGELTGCARLGGCPNPENCKMAGRCAAFTLIEHQERSPGRTPAPVMPTWPDQPSGKVPGMFMSTAQDQDNWNAYHVQFQAAAIARVKLGRATLVMMAAQCDECHGRRCQYCENTWKIIDQLEVPAWLR